MKNLNEDSDRTVVISLSAVVAFYTGVSSNRVGQLTHEEKIPAGGGELYKLLRRLSVCSIYHYATTGLLQDVMTI